MTQRATTNWIRNNEIIIGWVLAGLVYGGGIFTALNQQVIANGRDDAVQQEQINRNKEELGSYKTAIEDMNKTLQVIDKNVTEIKTELKYKKDK